MKRLLIPVLFGTLVFGVLAVPKVWLALGFFEEGGWIYAKTYFTRILIDFLFAWVIAVVVWLQLERRPWITTFAFCFSVLLASVFWFTPIKNAPRSFRQEMAFIYDFIEAAPMRELPRVPRIVERGAEPANIQEKAPATARTFEPVKLGPKEQVEKTFYSLLRSLKKYEYESVFTLADARTWTYFTELKELALTADREELEKLRPIDRFQVLALRHIKNAEQLSEINEKSLFRQAVLQGWFFVGDKPDVRIDFIDILSGGNEAQADIIVNSIIPDNRLEFIKEGGAWKMNLLQLLPTQEEKLMATFQERGQSETEFFWNFLKQETGKDPDPEIWDPVIEVPEQG